MRIFQALAALFLLAPVSALALDVKIELVGKPLLHVKNRKVAPGESVGALTTAVLTEAANLGSLSFDGDEGGLRSVNGVGSALEILSDAEMRAYGWCYAVDGVVSELMADQFFLDSLSPAPKRLRWFYAYAYYDHGAWTKQCEPADHLPVIDD
jgi:hypothetical protein